jgi:hypothetical protein
MLVDIMKLYVMGFSRPYFSSCKRTATPQVNIVSIYLNLIQLKNFTLWDIT